MFYSTAARRCECRRSTVRRQLMRRATPAGRTRLWPCSCHGHVHDQHNEKRRRCWRNVRKSNGSSESFRASTDHDKRRANPQPTSRAAFGWRSCQLEVARPLLGRAAAFRFGTSVFGPIGKAFRPCRFSGTAAARRVGNGSRLTGHCAPSYVAVKMNNESVFKIGRRHWLRAR